MLHGVIFWQCCYVVHLYLEGSVGYMLLSLPSNLNGLYYHFGLEKIDCS
jgi:hypothetical protein